ncbi:archaellum component FlaC [Alkalibacillus flavidus]|uniref:Archaellum component FlaC n=1 Tax=Alkalibacillus flavidus TaxID=546021 RepID=A0ABV2KX87_9BACI
MEEKNYEEELTHTEQEDERNSQSINSLKHDVESLKEQVEEMHIEKLLTKMHHMMERIDDQLQNLEEEIILQKANDQQSEETANTTQSQPKPRMSEYKMLQNMLQSSRSTGTLTNQRNSNLTRNHANNGHPSVPNMLNKNIMTRKSTK